MYTYKHRPKNAHTSYTDAFIQSKSPKCSEKLQEQVPHTKTRKWVHISKQLSRYSPKICRLQPVDVLPMSTLERQLKMKSDTSQTYFYACQTIRNCVGTFDMMRQSIIRLVQTYLESGGHFGHLLRTVTWQPTGTQQLLHWDRVLQMYYVRRK